MEEDVPEHHVKREYCETRPNYRKGKRKTCVRVFTVNTESKYLIVTEVPSPALESDLIKLFSAFGTLKHARELQDYPQEEFVKTYLMEFQDIQAAKTAKKYADEKYFYGGMLHVCYAPEYETVSDVREKIIYRRQSVTLRTKVLEKESRRLNKGKNAQGKTKTKDVKTGQKYNTVKVQNSISEEVSQPQACSLNDQPSSIAVNYPSLEQKPTNPIPCNNFGIPLFLPPPPPPPPPPYFDSTHETIFAAETNKTLHHTERKMDDQPKNLQDKSKCIVKKTSRLKTRTGYFHQKFVETMNKKFPESSKNDSTVLNLVAKKVNLNFKPPPFQPRNIKIKNSTTDVTSTKSC